MFRAWRYFLSCSMVVTFAAPSLADDWPQWMGPKRDNEWREIGLLDSIPSDGLKTVWKKNIAGGYAGPAVANGRVFVTDLVTDSNAKVDNFDRAQIKGTERVHCFDEKSGKDIWKHEYPVTYSISYPAGPRCTPTVDGDLVYTLGAEGDLFCFQAADGKIVWKKNLEETYKTKAALWGYASHPLIDGNKLIVLAGGAGSHCVALDKKTGKEIWKTGTAREQGYSPPVIIEAAGVRQMILMSPEAIYSVDPETGKEYWSEPYEADNGSIIMTPIRWKDFIFTGGFNNRNLLIKLDSKKPGAETVWKDIPKAAMSPVNVQPKLDGDIIYGMDGDGDLIAMEIESGKRIWTTPKPIAARKQQTGTAFLVKQADRWWLFNDAGEIVLAKFDRKGYTELGRASVIKPTNNAFGRPVVWCAPAFANKRMYVRNDEELICVNLAK